MNDTVLCSDTTVLINVAMTTPWNMMDQLQNWASLLQDHIDKLRLTAEQVLPTTINGSVS